jgi:hypothetical protein
LSGGFFKALYPVLYVNTGDVLTLIAGMVIVILVAVIANPQSLFPIKSEGSHQPGVTEQTPGIIQTTIIPEKTENGSPVLKKPDAPLYSISYTDKPFSYPLYRIPEHMEIFGASEIPSRTTEWVPFAYIENTRGGLTRFFSIPYPVWLINTTVVATTHPQYGIFRMVLCHADTGGIIKGEEIQNGGKSYRVVQYSNTSMYMIISTENIDSYYIQLETPRNYYDAYRKD